MVCAPDPGRFLGGAGRLSWVGLAFLAAYAVLALAGCWLCWRKWQGGAIVATTAAPVVLMPPHMLTFAPHWSLGLCGLLFFVG